ncbi:slipin family protein [Actinomadura algeriensis]|uniref:Regulator of protease activity HflC (Stomatin/prohibitin superfamily) n=1 Tax=Actinomadura algeriensis TaxID=1679523 RepID=A0ABR9JNW1_9ACTN|nr:slipin family protein [Actinomadura algeriensis]MBE1532250.1 regulator of protease activity HflC (stomatin/prohibitin superfamily) [Actinomadura algeriensis]
MEAIILIVLLGIVVVGFMVAGSAVRVVQQYEHGIVFRFGQVQRGGQLRPGAVRSPGLTAIIPVVERMQKISRQTITMDVPAQEGITEDNVSVRVDAVVYFRVIDPVKAIVNVQNYGYAVSQVAQTSLRSVIGQADMQELLGERQKINTKLRAIIDEITQDPWGILIERVEIKDVSLPEGMKRSMARQAEAERERRARIITADGEFQASKRLAAAAEIMSQDPAALQLRLLQTVVEVSAEKNSTLVMPLPVEILRFFDRMTGDAKKIAEAEPEEKPDLGERLAKAEQELAKAAEVSPALESPDEVPPVIGLDEPGRAHTGERQGVAGGEPGATGATGSQEAAADERRDPPLD